ncbi:hypothetical protein F4782DRAFT_550660 [Xylaria castorea]|nr:hypothetical protein F4782DRAFT_550660 [Xylaria castorea]
MDEEPQSPNSATYKVFIKDFFQILRQNNVIGLLGLCQYPGDDFEGRVEITEGRANINLHPDHFPRLQSIWHHERQLGTSLLTCWESVPASMEEKAIPPPPTKAMQLLDKTPGSREPMFRHAVADLVVMK